MKGKRRAHSDKFKAKIAMEAIKGIKTLSELATEHKIHPNQIFGLEEAATNECRRAFHSWKKK